MGCWDAGTKKMKDHRAWKGYEDEIDQLCVIASRCSL